MKRFLSFLILVASFPALAQTRDDIGKIILSVQTPEEMAGLSPAQVSNLHTKCIQLASSRDIAAVGYSTNFVLEPKFTITDTKVADGGMQNVTIVSADLSLYVIQPGTQVVYASVSKQLSGSGTTRDMAIANAIAKINAGDAQTAEFIATAKSKIISYYEGKCGDLMQQADAMAAKQDYEAAIGILMSIPEEVKSCYDKAQKKSLSFYKSYADKMCTQQLQAARIQLAANNYAEALEILRTVDPGCKCSANANELIKATAAKVSEQQKREWDAALKIYSDAIALENHRIDAEKEIAVAEYKHSRRK